MGIISYEDEEDQDSGFFKNNYVVVVGRDGNATNYSLDTESGRPILVSGRFTDRPEYNEKGFHTSLKDVNYEYDDKSNVTSIEAGDINFSLDLEYSEYGQITSSVDALGNQTTIEYDDKYLDKITAPSGVSVDFESNEYGQITKADGNQYNYDTYGNLDYVEDPAGNTTDYSYDEIGRLREIEDARGNTTDYDYTYYGVERITNTRGHSVEYEYDSKGNRTAVRDTMTNKEINYSYDRWDNLQSVTDPLGNSTNYYYNKNEQITMVRDSKDNTISYQYNEYDTVGQIRYTNPLGLNYTYQYDRYGRLIEEYDQTNNSLSYEYYPDGSVKKVIDSMGNETEYSYEDGRIVQSERNGVVTDYHYDDEGRVDYLTQGGERIEYEYNSLDQVSAVVDSQGRRIEYTYDEVGNIETMTVPGEGTFEYTYNNLNQVKTISTPDNETYTYSYDAAGRRTGIIYPNGKEISYSYDKFGRMETYDNGIETYTYSYDNMNITEIETAEGTISYEYDEMDRLTGVFYPDGESIEYEHDTAGNRTSKTVTEIVDGKPEVERITYSYDFSNRMTRAGDVRYEYDSKDRLVSKIDGSDIFEYSYNDLNQLISVTKNGTEVASFGYDLMGRRVSETINGIEKEYLWSGDSLLGEYSGNSLNRLYAVGNGVDEVLGIYNESEETQYLHSNHVGSVTGVTDTDGSILGERDYSPFGVERSTSGNIDTDLGFIGREHYDEIGLLYIRARFYEPSSGRFITKDYVRDGYNWYSYCNGNPIVFVDSSGYEGVIVIVGGIVLILAVGSIYIASHPSRLNEANRIAHSIYRDIQRMGSYNKDPREPHFNDMRNRFTPDPVTGGNKGDWNRMGKQFRQNPDDQWWKKALKWAAAIGTGIIGGDMANDLMETWGDMNLTKEE